MKSLLPLTAALFIAVGCASAAPDVKHQGDAHFDSNLKTYAVVDHPVGNSPSTRSTFNARIHPTMERKGYERAPQAQADLFISFKALWTSDESTNLNLSGSNWLFMQGAMLGPEMPSEDVQKVVLVMIEEARTDRVIWIGWSSAEVERDRVLTSTGTSIDEILGRIPARM